MQAASSDVATTGERAYLRIRRDLIFGRLAPGARLRLDALKTTYGVSVSTLREILSRLSSEGMVLTEGQRGFAVAPVSQHNFREVAAMRELLEAHAMEESFRLGDLDWEARVAGAYHKLARLEELMLQGDRGQTETWKRYDRDFHRALISACGSMALMQTHALIYDRYVRYQIIAVIFRGEPAAGEHRRLLDCALSRDAATAADILKRHISACVDHTLEHGLL